MGKKGKLHPKPGMTMEEKAEREKRFILDCVAIATLSTYKPYLYTPRLGSVIPPYNAQKDKIIQEFFDRPTTKKTLRRTGQEGGGSVNGKQADFFNEKGHLGKCLAQRNENGAGYGAAEVAGHELFMDINKSKPVIGYNGPSGVRRNTPELRKTYGKAEPECDLFTFRSELMQEK